MRDCKHKDECTHKVQPYECAVEKGLVRRTSRTARAAFIGTMRCIFTSTAKTDAYAITLLYNNGGGATLQRTKAHKIKGRVGTAKKDAAKSRCCITMVVGQRTLGNHRNQRSKCRGVPRMLWSA
jgi:hypothetical protein